MNETDLTAQPSSEEHLPKKHDNEQVANDTGQPDAVNDAANGEDTAPPPDTLPESPAITEDEPAESNAQVQSAEATPPPVQQTRRSTTYRPTTLTVGVLLIALGVILVWPVFSGGYILVAEVIIAIIIAGIALSLLAYWLNTGRQARGAFFLAILGLLWAGLTGFLLFAPAAAATSGNWPFYIVALGAAFLVTTIGDRLHDARLVPPGIISIIVGLAALTVTKQLLPAQTRAITQRFWPWLAVFVILGMLPLAIRHAPRQK